MVDLEPRSAPGRALLALRPYQRAAVDAVFAYVRTEPGHPLVVIPTGGGKSLIMGTLVAEALANHPTGRALILAHRKELIQQNVRAVASVLPLGQIGIYSAGLRRRDTDTPILVAGIQSVARRPYDIGAFDVILIDEAHLVPRADGTLYHAFITAARQLNPNVVFVGLTATPYRMDSGLLHRGDDALFTEIAYEAGVSELMADGYLCPLVSRGTTVTLDVTGVGTRGGEFIPGQLERAVDQEALTNAIAAEMIRRLEDRRKWLVFCAGVAHADHMAAALRARGIPAAAVHGELDAGDRAERLAAFREGTLRAVTSMDVLTTGFDEPAIDAVVLVRPTKSTGLYVQMVGRGFRLHPSKANTLVLDFAGNVARHGPVDLVTVRDKASSAGEGAPPVKSCPACEALLFAGLRVCPECAHEFPAPPPEIEATPSILPILSTEPVEPIWWDVSDVLYGRHVKPDKPTSLRVDYYDGIRRVASTWVCLEHDGFARQKAAQWWAQHDRSGQGVPRTVDEALTRVDGLRRPLAIATLPEGKFTRVTALRFEEEQAIADDGHGPADTSCANCEHFLALGESVYCAHWAATPPIDVQAIGCPAFRVADVPF